MPELYTARPFFTTEAERRDPLSQHADELGVSGMAPELWDLFNVAGRPLPGLARVSGLGFAQKTDKKKAPGKHAAAVSLLGEEPSEFEVSLRIWTQSQLEAFSEFIDVLRPNYNGKAKSKEEPAVQSTKLSSGLHNFYDYGAPGALPPPTIVGPTERASMGDLRLREFDLGLHTPEKKPVASVDTGPKPLDVDHPKLRPFKIISAFCLACSLAEEQSDGTYLIRIKWLEYRDPKKRNKGGVENPEGSKSDLIRNMRQGKVEEMTRVERPSDFVSPSGGA
jgi:hypothetical protein